MYVIRYHKWTSKKDSRGDYRYLSGFQFSKYGFEYSSTLDESEALKLSYVSASAVFDLLSDNFRRDSSFKHYSLELINVDNS